MARRFPRTSETATPTIWSPDAPPASPHALDDEFLGASLSADWTIGPLDTGTTLTGKVENSKLVLVRSEESVIENSMFFKDVPAVSDYTITAKVRMHRPNASSTIVGGLFLAEDLNSSPTTRNTFQLAYEYTADQLSYNARDDFMDTGANTALSPAFDKPFAYLRIRVATTTVDLDVSWDGVVWEELISNVTHNLSSIDTFGVFSDNRSPFTDTVSFDWVRVTEVSTFGAPIGGFIA